VDERLADLHPPEYELLVESGAPEGGCYVFPLLGFEDERAEEELDVAAVALALHDGRWCIRRLDVVPTTVVRGRPDNREEG
jgi:hypothetical protein